MAHFTTLTSRVVLLLVNDIDTDQIIPARFLKATDKIGMGDHLFADWRYESDGSPKSGFVLNAPEAKGAAILLAGDNFGCGSSREHAPWALTSFGFRAVLSTSFADIFRNNSTKNGLLPIVVDKSMHAALVEHFRRQKGATMTIDLQTQVFQAEGGPGGAFSIDPFARTCLLNGVDELGYIQQFEQKIKAFEATHGVGGGS
ncbi:MAG: 3-isopropylmalate dehydratase small subunit [Bacteroidota bacterium]